MKKLYVLVITTIFAISAFSQQEDANIVIEMNDNSSQTIAFDQLSRITFSGTTVNIEQFNGNTIKSDMSDILRIATYANNTGISSAILEGNELLQYISSDEISINCNAGETIAIYNINGSKILTRRQTADGGSISIATLPKGIYLIRANGKTAKFIKR